jgi:hypothetical protein
MVLRTFSPFWPVRSMPWLKLPLRMSAPFVLPNLSFIRLLPSPTLFFDFGSTIFADFRGCGVGVGVGEIAQ